MPLDSLTTFEKLGIMAKTLLNPMMVFGGMSMVTKLCLIIVLAIGAVVLITAIIRRTTGGKRSDLLAVLGWTAVAGGLLGAAYGVFSMYIGATMSGTTDLVVLAPGIFEIIYSLVPAFIIWQIARIGNEGAKKA